MSELQLRRRILGIDLGRARIGVMEEPEELHPGDYICYPGDVPHIFEALEPGTYGVEISEYV